MSAAGAWRLALERNVRANPAFRLRPLASLPEQHQQRMLAALNARTPGGGGSAIFGLLTADPGSGLGDKVVDPAAAELFAGLRRPGRLPAHAADRLAQLVLDGVLEIECPDGFRCGPLAYEALAEPGAPPAASDRLGRLSHAAVEYAARLKLADVDRTAARLYCYNRVPLSQRWIRAYPGPAAVLDLLRCPGLSRDWVPNFADDGPVDWLSWCRRGEPAGRRGPMRYKLYVSPAVDALPDVLPVLADALTAAGARRFKVGPNAAGLLRADKIVVYADDPVELAGIARALEDALAGVRAHGVPFAAELAGDGLLSWGGDPPGEDAPFGARPESWRVSVCRRVAEYLTVAGAAPLRRISPAAFALARLAVDGVDVRTFAPAGLEPPAPHELAVPAP